MKSSAPRPNTQRNRSRWLSLAAGERERLAPPWTILLVSALTAFGLIVVFPNQNLERRLSSSLAEAEELRIDYLKLWLRARPHDIELRRLLLRQLSEIGHYADARAELQRLAPDISPADYRLLALDLDWREAYAVPSSDPRHAALLDQLHQRIDGYSHGDGSAAELASLAELASRVGATEAATRLHERLLARRAELSPGWWEQAAQRMLALGNVDQAAALYLRAQSLAQLPANQRRWLFDALRALQSGARLDQALAVAQEHSASLGDDPDALLFLTGLARSAHRPDQSQRYAEQLVALKTGPAGAPQIGRPYHDPAYRLAYEVFVENGRLPAATALAQAALRHVPGSVDWRRRLAQVADWSGAAPLALEQWRQIARNTQSQAAWLEVERRAPQVLDHAAWLEALLELYRREASLERARAIVTAHELLGNAEAAIDFLATLKLPKQREWALETRAMLEANLGREAERAVTLRRLIADFGPTASRATELANAEFARGNPRAAWDALQLARAVAGTDPDYWNTYAQLAQLMGHRDEAVLALRQLIASGNADESTYLNAVNLLGPQDPVAAAAIAAAGWQRWHTPYLATQVLALYERGGKPEAARQFLARLSPDERSRLERIPSFLAARAYFRLSQGEAKAALEDARRGLRGQPGQTDLVALVLWSAVAASDTAIARSTLAGQEALALQQAALWPAWAAGWLALNEPRRALPWLQRLLRSATDPLTWLTYADALDQLGQGDLAWRARRHAWLALRAGRLPAAAAPELPARLLNLAPLFESGDTGRARLRRVLADSSQSGYREAALSWFLSRELDELARAWMLARYSSDLAQPSWADLSVALAQDDRARVAQLLDSVADWLPARDRVTGASLLRRSGQAQDLAFESAERAPDSDETHAQLTETLLERPASSGLSFAQQRQWPLTTQATRLSTGLRPTPRSTLQLEAKLQHHATLNTAVLASVPARDREAAAVLTWPGAGDSTLRARFNVRSALHTQAGAALELEQPAPGRLQLKGSAEWRQPTDENAYLTLGAARDRLAGQLSWQATPREVVSLALDASRYLTQTGASIGNGHTLRIEAGSSLNTGYPQLGARLWWLDQSFSASGAIDPSIAPLVPVDLRHLGARLLLPPSSQQIGLTLSAGSSAAEGYSRAWRPWGELSVYRDSLSGMNTNWTLGLAGSLAGSDRLALVWSGGTATSSNPVPYRRVGLSWQWFH